jgi:glutamine cyclotransferase
MKNPLATAALLIVALLVLDASILVLLNNNKPTANSAATHYTYTIVNTYPHDTNAFTEGLVYSDGFLYESTGLNGESSLRRVNLTAGNILQEITLPSQYFGEGITIVNNTIIQLTWQSQIGFVYDKTTFALLQNFTYPTEGWGLTFDGKHLIMSDGTDNLYFLDPTTFQRTGQTQVHDGNTSIANINELEYINGDIYANIWLTNKIAIINPNTGQIKAWIDLTGLPAENNSNPNAVLNGIAYDQQNNRLFVTGKDWPNLYQIKLIPQTNPST